MSKEQLGTIGDRVFNQAQELKLVPPQGVVFLSNASVKKYKPDDSRGLSPFRKIGSTIDPLADDILRQEIQAMFPSENVNFRFADIGNYPNPHIRALCEKADLILVSLHTMDEPRGRQVASDFALKKPVVFGGPHVTRGAQLFHEATDSTTAIVVGRVEGQLPRVLSAVQKNEYRGKTFRRVKPFDAAADYHTLPRRSARSSLLRYNPTGVPIEAGVGCGEKCDFCAILTFRESSRDPRQLISELERIYDRGIRYVIFVDDNFSKRPSELLQPVFEFINARNMGWVGEGTRDILDDPVTARLAGRNNIGFLHGIEDYSDQVTRTHGSKSRTKKEVIDDVRALQKYGFVVFGSIIIGLDNHLIPDTLKKLAEPFWSGCLLMPVTIHIATPYPGTPFYKKLHQAGRIFDYDLGNYNLGCVVFNPERMLPEEVISSVRWLQRELGSPEIAAKVISRHIKDGRSKYLRLNRAFPTLIGMTLDNGFVGLSTYTNPQLQETSRSFLNKIWPYLSPEARHVACQ